MSFSFDAKNELCRLPVQKLCCARAEAYGMLLYCNTFSASEVRIITGNPALAARLPKLFHRAFGLRFDRLPEEGESGKLVFQITDGEASSPDRGPAGLQPGAEPGAAHQLRHAGGGVLPGFLPAGACSSPAAASPTPSSATIWSWRLPTCRPAGNWRCCCGRAAIPPKSVCRNGSFVTYFKQSDQIEDFLTSSARPWRL